jgi:hypothetical protein
MPLRRRRARVARPKREVSRTSKSATRRTGSGDTKGAGSGSSPITSVSSSSNITGPSSTIQAAVQGGGTGLSKSDIKPYLDGAEQTEFSHRRIPPS